MNGYGDALLPAYRIVPIVAHASIRNRFGQHWSEAPVISSLLPEAFRVWGEESHFKQPIAEIVSAAASVKDGRFQLLVQWPQELAIKFGAKGYKDFECLGAWQTVSPHALVGIVDTVRSRLLEFALKIEAENPDAGEAELNRPPVPLEKLRPLVHNVFYGPVGSVAQNSDHFEQTAVRADKADGQ